MIMLQDVAIILELRIHGPVVTETCEFNVVELCRELLNVIPPADALKEPLSPYGGYVTSYPP